LTAFNGRTENHLTPGTALVNKPDWSAMPYFPCTEFLLIAINLKAAAVAIPYADALENRPARF